MQNDCFLTRYPSIDDDDDENDDDENDDDENDNDENDSSNNISNEDSDDNDEIITTRRRTGSSTGPAGTATRRWSAQPSWNSSGSALDSLPRVTVVSQDTTSQPPQRRVALASESAFLPTRQLQESQEHLASSGPSASRQRRGAIGYSALLMTCAAMAQMQLQEEGGEEDNSSHDHRIVHSSSSTLAFPLPTLPTRSRSSPLLKRRFDPSGPGENPSHSRHYSHRQTAQSDTLSTTANTTTNSTTNSTNNTTTNRNPTSNKKHVANADTKSLDNHHISEDGLSKNIQDIQSHCLESSHGVGAASADLEDHDNYDNHDNHRRVRRRACEESLALSTPFNLFNLSSGETSNQYREGTLDRPVTSHPTGNLHPKTYLKSQSCNSLDFSSDQLTQDNDIVLAKEGVAVAAVLAQTQLTQLNQLTQLTQLSPLTQQHLSSRSFNRWDNSSGSTSNRNNAINIGATQSTRHSDNARNNNQNNLNNNINLNNHNTKRDTDAD